MSWPTIVAPASATQAFVSDTPMSPATIIEIRRDGIPPSTSPIAQNTSTAAASELTNTAASVAAHTDGPIAVGRGRQRVERDRRQRRGQRELGEVEEQPRRALAGREDQHDRRAQDRRDHGVARVGQQQAEHERHLGQRQRVRAPAHVCVHDEALGRRKGDGERPPRDAHVRLVGNEVADDAQPQRDRRDGSHGGQREEGGLPQSSERSIHESPDQRRPDHRRPDQRRPFHCAAGPR